MTLVGGHAERNIVRMMIEYGELDKNTEDENE
jgi:hypothetical protein